MGVGLTWLHRILKRGYLNHGRAFVATLVDERGERCNKVISKLSVLDDEFLPCNESRIRYVSKSNIVGEEFYEDEKAIDYVDFLRRLKADRFQANDFLLSIFEDNPPAYTPFRKRIERDKRRYELALRKYRRQVYNLIHDCQRFEYLSELEWVNLDASIELAFAQGKPPISAFFDFCRSVGVVGHVHCFRRYLGNGEHVRATVWAYM